jgi:hypothetical protein
MACRLRPISMQHSTLASFRFSDGEGQIVFSSRFRNADREALGLNEGLRLWNVAPGHLPRLAWHRTNLAASARERQMAVNLPISSSVIAREDGAAGRSRLREGGGAGNDEASGDETLHGAFPSQKWLVSRYTNAAAVIRVPTDRQEHISASRVDRQSL